MLAGAAGGASVTIFHLVRRRGAYDVCSTCNGVLSGCVSITAGCATCPIWAAVLSGGMGGLIYLAAAHTVLHRLKVDDVVDAVAVHGACGCWGVISAALFAHDAALAGVRSEGLFFGDGKLLGAACVCCVAVSAWASGLAALLFLGLKRVQLLRIDGADERREAHSAQRETAVQLQLVSAMDTCQHGHQHEAARQDDLSNSTVTAALDDSDSFALPVPRPPS